VIEVLKELWMSRYALSKKANQKTSNSLKPLFSFVFIGLILLLMFIRSGSEDLGEYSNWQTMVVDGKRRTPQGSFYIDSNGTEYPIALQNSNARGFWYRVDYFDEVQVRLTEGRRIAALRFREEKIYGIDEFEEAAERTYSTLTDKMIQVSVIYSIIMIFLLVKERR
jgi:hypothetical protein